MLLGVLYTLFPGDFDYIPFVGWLDDAAVWVVLYRLLMAGGKWKRDWEEGAASGDGSREEAFRRPEEDGDRSARESKRPRTPHEVLGVSPAASREEIRHAYREMANKYHPDKVAHLGEEFRTMAEERFKEIQEAYQRLGG